MQVIELDDDDPRTLDEASQVTRTGVAHPSSEDDRALCKRRGSYRHGLCGADLAQQLCPVGFAEQQRQGMPTA